MLDIQVTMVRLFAASVLGGILGLEREKKGGSAGLRTHILVALGSCLIMLTSLYIYEISKDKVNVDPGRIAAQVVTGIGFLGAGTILRSEAGVRGLTTAASIWVAAGIGLAVGCGYMSAALGTTVVAYIVLSVLKKLEKPEKET